MIVKLLQYKKTILIAKAILLTLLSLLFVEYLNFFSFITFIPDDQVFPVGLTFYLAVFEVMWQLISEIVQDKATAKLHIAISNSNDPKTNKEDVTCLFSTVDTSYIYGEIQINCPPKRLRKMNIVIVFPSWVIVQQNLLDDRVVEVTNPHVCKLILGKFIGNEISEHVISKYSFKVSLLKNIPDSTGRTDKIECRLEYSESSLINYFTEFIINNRVFVKSN